MYIQQKLKHNPSMDYSTQNLYAMLIGCTGSFITAVKVKLYLLEIPPLLSKESLIKLVWCLLVGALTTLVTKSVAHYYDRLLRPIQEKFIVYIKNKKWLKWIYKNKN